MQNTEGFTENLPWFVADRRRTPDRRTPWRGGRRDTDWTVNRPSGVLDRLASSRTEWFAPWRRWVPTRDSSQPHASH